MKGLLFVLVMTYGGAAMALFRPFYGLVVYMCFAILRPQHLWQWSLSGEGNYSKIIGIALLVGWAIHGCGDWNFGRAKPIFLSLLGLWLCIIASASMASNQEVAWSYVELHSKILLPVLVGMTIIRSISEIRILAWTLAICLGFLAYEAHSMYYGGQLVTFREVGMLGMDNNSISITMATGAGVGIILGFTEKLLPARIIAFGLTAMMVHVPMFGHSRGGMMGVAIVGFMAFLVLPKRPGMLFTYAVGLLVAIRLAGETVVERFSTIFAEHAQRDASSQSRIDLWADCWDVMIHHPIFGVGPNHWPLTASQYGWPPGKEAHSVWFNCGAELGFVGLFFLLSLYLGTMFLAWRYLVQRRGIPGPCREAGQMAITGLSGFIVSASFVSLDALEVPFYVVLIGVAAMKIASRTQLRRLRVPQHQLQSNSFQSVMRHEFA
jgi:probable O-glycosylation ligase (exosortase A-associated)